MAGSGSQITKLNVNAIKLALPFGFDTTQEVLDAIAAAALTGKTYDFSFSTQLPLPAASADGSSSHYRIQYSRDGQA